MWTALAQNVAVDTYSYHLGHHTGTQGVCFIVVNDFLIYSSGPSEGRQRDHHKLATLLQEYDQFKDDFVKNLVFDPTMVN